MAFTETEFTTFQGHFTQTIAAPTYLASNFGSLQAALNAMAATGGTLTLTADATYNITAQLNIVDAERFKINGNNATIVAAASLSGAADVLEITRCRNFRIDDLNINGNKEVRSSGVGMGLKLTECCSTFVGGGGASMIRVKAINCPEDGLRMVANISNPIDVNRIPRNILWYKCEGHHCGRVGSSLINGYNIQIIGGAYNENGKDFGKALPAAGIDMEPNPNGTVVPGCEQFLYKGITFKGNNRTGMSLSSRMAPESITVEGCLFDGASTDVEAIPSGNLGHGGGLTVKSTGVLVRKNIFQNFSTHYNPLSAACIFLQAAECINNTVIDNLFIDNSCTLPVVAMTNLIGTGNQVINNRHANNAGAFAAPAGGISGKCVVSGNDPNNSTPPFPLPPIDVTFAEDGAPTFPGGDVEFDADSTNGAEFIITTNWTHTPVGVPKGVIVEIAQRGSAADQVTGVTYGGVALARYAFAADTTIEVGAAYGYFLGDGVLTGPRTVEVTVIPGAAGGLRAHCKTVTADGDTGIAAFGIVQENVQNPAIPLATAAGLECFVSATLFFGGTAAQVAVGADYTQVAEYEHAAARTLSFMRRTNDSTGGTVSANWITTISDDVAGIAVAISSVEDVPTNVVFANPTGFERTRGFSLPTVNVTTPPVVTVNPEGFERTREFTLPTVTAVLGAPRNMMNYIRQRNS